MKSTYLISLFLFYTCSTQALELSEAKAPAAVSFLIADLKYSRQNGVKICEVQHGTDSTFYGDKFSHGGKGLISVNLVHTLLNFQSQFWTHQKSFVEKAIQNLVEDAPEWHSYEKMSMIETDPLFLERCYLPPADPYDVRSYFGFIIARNLRMKREKCFKQYPGILLLDKVSLPYWNDKYKMTELFSRDEVLAKVKPRWNLYKKGYTPSLAQEIIEDLQCERFVIKPRRAYMGYGVIVTDHKNLDQTLRYILSNSQQLKEDPDKSYFYWFHDPEDAFIVEEFCESDPIKVPHLNNEVYQPTMRVAFLMVYSNCEIKTHFLGFYWLLPRYPLSANVPLTIKHKAEIVVPYFCSVEPETEKEVQSHLEQVLPLLFREMLTDYSSR